jgi:enoyl-[acyl-carrier-protein] reductase (NADH)
VDESFLARYAQLSPSRRMLDASEIPGPVIFLLGDASSAVSGHVLVADGGWSLW